MRAMRSFTVDPDGFCGFFHEPAGESALSDRLAGKAIIVLGGSEGNDNIPVNLGARFAREGIAALGLRYWNAPGLPDELVEVPLESVERAAAFLHSERFDKVGVYGISKGGELALLSASLMPELGCVAALSPLDHAMPGITGSGGIASKGISERSSWTWRGKPVPCAPGGARLPYAAIVWRLLTERQLSTRFVYERLLDEASGSSAIRVEDIAGPVLLVSPDHDALWPSDAACRRVEKRLREHGHPWEVMRLSYEHASHIMVPMEGSMNAKSLRMFREERQHPKECAASREHAFAQTIAFLERW